MTVFWGEKFPFSRQKFLMTFFSHRPGFRIFYQIVRIFTMLNIVYDLYTALSSQEKPLGPYFTKEFLYITLSLLCSCFRAHPTKLLLKILRGRMHGPSPTSNLLGRPSPPVPLGLRPCENYVLKAYNKRPMYTA